MLQQRWFRGMTCQTWLQIPAQLQMSVWLWRMTGWQRNIVLLSPLTDKVEQGEVRGLGDGVMN